MGAVQVREATSGASLTWMEPSICGTHGNWGDEQAAGSGHHIANSASSHSDAGRTQMLASVSIRNMDGNRRRSERLFGPGLHLRRHEAQHGLGLHRRRKPAFFHAATRIFIGDTKKERRHHARCPAPRRLAAAQRVNPTSLGPSQSRSLHAKDRVLGTFRDE